ncbi:MAG: PaaI family thioesterase [Hyphomicrobiaceae bacterium]|nr:PaaI family thioesterase [Hyphomicrobiaceae bacterium]
MARSEDIRDLTGQEMLQAIIDGRLPQAPIAQGLRFRLVEVREGFAAFEGEPSEHLRNPLGTVHGGWALTLIDSAAGCAAHSLLPAGVAYTTLETKANFSRPILAETGTVRAEGTVLTRGRRIVTAEARVLGPDARILAHGTSTLLILGTSQ